MSDDDLVLSARTAQTLVKYLRVVARKVEIDDLSADDTERIVKTLHDVADALAMIAPENEKQG